MTEPINESTAKHAVYTLINNFSEKACRSVSLQLIGADVVSTFLGAIDALDREADGFLAQEIIDFHEWIGTKAFLFNKFENKLFLFLSNCVFAVHVVESSRT